MNDVGGQELRDLLRQHHRLGAQSGWALSCGPRNRPVMKRYGWWGLSRAPKWPFPAVFGAVEWNVHLPTASLKLQGLSRTAVYGGETAAAVPFECPSCSKQVPDPAFARYQRLPAIKISSCGVDFGASGEI